jgi:cell wall-associated NlpC family hydrolase
VRPLNPPPEGGGVGPTAATEGEAIPTLLKTSPSGAARHLPPQGEDLPTVILAEARQWLGTPYRHQASTRGVACDCLGLVRGVWRALHGPEPETPPPYRPDWAEIGGREQIGRAHV